MANEPDIIHRDLCYSIVGAAMDVHSELGVGFLEAVYHESLCIEMKRRGIPYEKEKELEIKYKGETLEKKYKADLIVAGEIIIELNAKSELTTIEESQMLNYLKCTGLRLGILINFGSKSLEWK